MKFVDLRKNELFAKVQKTLQALKFLGVLCKAYFWRKQKVLKGFR